MKLIREEIEQVEFIVENKNGKKSLFIEGVFLQGNIKNRNGRMYPMETLRREVSRYNENHVVQGRALGELGHPDGPTVNLDRVSHMITSLTQNGNDFEGKAKILNTPNGNIVQSLLAGGANLGVSTRGVGSLKPQGGFQLVQDDFHLATAADIVADPSAPDAWVSGIMESTEWVLTNAGWKPMQYEKARKMIKEATKSEIEDVALKLWTNYISKL
jgi:hypothetical protein